VTALLASVASLEEVEVALAGGVDIIDLKDPGRGALGAWPQARIADAVARVAGQRPVSATIGDLPMDPDVVAAAASHTAAAGVDVVKVGFFPGAERRACIRALAGQAAPEVRLVAVLFADRDPDLDLLPALAVGGFEGVMLDTADKGGKSLRKCLGGDRLARFAAAARGQGLAVGLAGSLELEDVAPLLALAPDFLGFRRALCGDSGREGTLDPGAIAALKAAFQAHGVGRQRPAARQATATAGAQVAAQSLAGGVAVTRLAKST
jgi:uncharacterized protein (UPF0264 family)